MDISPGDRSAPLPSDAATLGLLASSAMDLAFMRPARLGVLSAWYGHVPFAHWLTGAIRPGLVVELGAHNGVSYAAFCEAVARIGSFARCHAVDTWAGDEHAGFYGDEVYQDLREFHDVRYGGFSELMRCTFDEALPFFADGTVDLLHIDGLHTYEAVRHDWEAWRPKLSPRAVVLFHDINEHQGSFGVWRLWDELRAEHPSFTFLHSHGLGVLAPSAEVPDAVAALCALSASPAEAGRVRERFAHLGARWDAQGELVRTLAARRAAEAQAASLSAELAAGRAQRDEALAAAAADRAAAEAAARLRDDLDEALAYHDELERTLAERDAHAGRLHANLAFRAAEWERVHVVLAAKDASLATQETALAAQATDLAEARHLAQSMRQSASWRLGAPLRAVSRTVPGVADGARRAAILGRTVARGELGQRRALRRQQEAEIAALRASPLFDAAYYGREHPELAAAGHDPAAHYAWVGGRAGAKPNPYFDGAWYLAQNPDVSGNPLLHWQDHGVTAGLDPNPFLKAAWYRERYPDAGPDALLHYLQVGAAENRDPNPMLDAEAYLLEYPDAREAGLGALLHWWHHGLSLGCNPHPLFDAAWYRTRHALPPGADPLAHWLETGQRAGLPTSPLVERTGGVLQPMRFGAPADPAVSVPAVSVIVPVYGHYADTVRCLYALLTATGDAPPYEVLVVDDNPQERTAPLLQRRIPGLRCVENPSNLGFLRSCNGAAKQTRGHTLVFLNNDTAVHPGWLGPTLALLTQDARVGLVGCKLLNPDGTVQEAGGAIGSDGWGIPYGLGDDPAKPEYNFVREVDVAIGACIAVRRTAWEEAGGFDDRYAPAFYEEFDLAFTLRARGWRVMFQPASVVDHTGSNSYGAEARDRHSLANHAKFCAKWAATLRKQPAPRAAPFLLRERPHSAGTLLFIDDGVPQWDRHAGALSTLHYLRIWQEMGFKVVFVPAAFPEPRQPYTAQLQQEGVEVLHAPETLPAWLGRNGRFVTVIWAARPDVTSPLLELLRRRCDAPVLYCTHDLHYLREQRRWEVEHDPEALAASKRYRRMEHAIFAAADHVLSLSSVEAAMIRQEVPSADVHVIPIFTYPEPPPLPEPGRETARDTVLFVGGYAHPPNVDAARFLVAEVMPLVWREAPEVHVVLAGSSPPPEVQALSGPRVTVPGFTENLAPLYTRARMGVSPLRYGAGIKGKVISALYEGVPVVTTAVGNEGLDLVHGEQAMVADGAEQLAAAILALWHDPAACRRLAEAGRAVVSNRFTAGAAKATLSALVAADRPNAAPPAAGRRSPARHPALGHPRKET